MKRKYLVFLFIITATFALVLPAYAIFCSQCGTQNPDDAVYCSNCGAKLLHPKETDIYREASDLLSQYRYDQAIALLFKHCAINPADTKAEVLLAKAYLGKCTLLKENSDKQYQTLVWKPFNIGKKVIVQRENDPKYLSEGLYICARSYLINHREGKAKRYIKKAIKVSPSSSPEIDYYFVLGDANAKLAIIEYRKRSESTFPRLYKEAQETYEQIIAMDVSDEIKSQAYYKLGILFSEFNKKEEAKTALESALQSTNNEILASRIHNKLESIDK